MNVLNEIGNITFQMWEKGWDEYNAGNVSYLLDDEEIKEFNITSTGRYIEFEDIPKNLKNRYVAITASGSHFRVIRDNLKQFTGIIRVVDDLSKVEIVYGFENFNKPTSELYTHLLDTRKELK